MGLGDRPDDGKAEARLRGPRGLVSDGSRLYVADTGASLPLTVK